MKLLTTRSGKQVEVLHIQYERCPEDTFIVEASYVDEDDGENSLVPDSILDELTQDYSELLYEAWYNEHQIGCGEDLCDRTEER
jgi:hypothetical protein